MAGPHDIKYKERPSSDEQAKITAAVRRRMKKMRGSSMTYDDSRDDNGNSRLSTNKKVTQY